MKMAQSLLLFLILISQTSQAMLIPAILPALKFAPMIIAAGGVVMIKVNSYFRDKRLVVIEGKIDGLQEGVTHLQEGLDNAHAVLKTVNDKIVVIETATGAIQVSVKKIQEALGQQGKSMQDIVEKHDTLHILATNHSEQLELLTSNTNTIAQRLDSESKQSSDRHAHVLSLHEQYKTEFAQIAAQIKELKDYYSKESDLRKKQYDLVNKKFDALTQQVASIDSKTEKTHEVVVKIDRFNDAIIKATTNSRSVPALEAARTVFPPANKKRPSYGNPNL